MYTGAQYSQVLNVHRCSMYTDAEVYTGAEYAQVLNVHGWTSTYTGAQCTLVLNIHRCSMNTGAQSRGILIVFSLAGAGFQYVWLPCPMFLILNEWG